MAGEIFVAAGEKLANMLFLVGDYATQPVAFTLVHDQRLKKPIEL
jgi:hypothetical protein